MGFLWIHTQIHIVNRWMLLSACKSITELRTDFYSLMRPFDCLIDKMVIPHSLRIQNIENTFHSPYVMIFYHFWNACVSYSPVMEMYHAILTSTIDCFFILAFAPSFPMIITAAFFFLASFDKASWSDSNGVIQSSFSGAERKLKETHYWNDFNAARLLSTGCSCWSRSYFSWQ